MRSNSAGSSNESGIEFQQGKQRSYSADFTEETATKKSVHFSEVEAQGFKASQSREETMQSWKQFRATHLTDETLKERFMDKVFDDMNHKIVLTKDYLLGLDNHNKALDLIEKEMNVSSKESEANRTFRKHVFSQIAHCSINENWHEKKPVKPAIKRTPTRAILYTEDIPTTQHSDELRVLPDEISDDQMGSPSGDARNPDGGAVLADVEASITSPGKK